MAQTNPPFMSGVPELLVLRLLARQEMYGYELVRAVKLVTGETISLGEGVIYPVLHGLEKNGALKADARLSTAVPASITVLRRRVGRVSSV